MAAAPLEEAAPKAQAAAEAEEGASTTEGSLTEDVDAPEGAGPRHRRTTSGSRSGSADGGDPRRARAGDRRCTSPQLRPPPDAEEGERAWRAWCEEARLVEVCRGPLLRPRGGFFAWVRRDNGPDDRRERREAATWALAAAAAHGAPPPFLMHRAPGPRAIADAISARSGAGGCRMERARCGTVLEEAVARARGGARVALVNVASGYHLGGGLLTGGRHALEEALCMQTTLYASLRGAAHAAHRGGERDALGSRVHIPERGAVLSPGVWALRGGTDTGYGPLRGGPVELAGVVSVAMPNLSPGVRDSPVAARGPSYPRLLEAKWWAVMEAAERSGAEALVVPDAGCGVFRNRPEDVGEALGRVLVARGAAGLIVAVCGSDAFYDAVVRGAAHAASARAAAQLDVAVPRAVAAPQGATQAAAAPAQEGADRAKEPALGRAASSARLAERAAGLWGHLRCRAPWLPRLLAALSVVAVAALARSVLAARLPLAVLEAPFIPARVSPHTHMWPEIRASCCERCWRGPLRNFGGLRGPPVAPSSPVAHAWLLKLLRDKVVPW